MKNYTILKRELKYMFYSFLFLGLAFIPFHRGYFKLPQKKIVSQIESDIQQDEDVILNNVHYYDTSHKVSPNKKVANTPVIHSTFFYVIFSILFLVFVFPLRYLFYLMNYLISL
ncbi:hypothetical protein KMW28_13975 [Flammeovirga yaeyamensis]|uniref:Uncharacterized protein n=1 Tax=Flammeovirga yaeyamensis TaxID=367791 RepID=A0AAX1MZU7_9BACT|nr:hypothetical protein [Flammeovirga yaeyamensis]MBB3700307.1 hypothetical protein [Flammeovirga yaeyamensis]NMF37067.1 hypothetical protein [Flammeovirga yaeyamensis]QWG00759.1 hypothetical protein KMW28_13975 [Flammeovirga yaeyamensis]